MSALSRQHQPNQAVGEVNPVHSGEIVKPLRVNIGLLLGQREALYRTRVLSGTQIQWPTMRTLSFLYNCLEVRKSLYISVTEVMGQMHLSPAWLTRGTVASVMNELAMKGVMQRGTRKPVRGSQLVVTYGLTGKGKQMLALYFAYLSGDYDHLLPAGLGA